MNELLFLLTLVKAYCIYFVLLLIFLAILTEKLKNKIALNGSSENDTTVNQPTYPYKPCII